MSFETYRQQISTAWQRGRRVGWVEGFGVGALSVALVFGLCVWWL